MKVYMNVSGKRLTKYLLNKRVTQGADGQPAASSSGDSGASSSAARGHVIAAARLLPLPWDAALGYGNPKREVRLDYWHNSTCTEAQPHFLHRFGSRCNCILLHVDFDVVGVGLGIAPVAAHLSVPS